MSDDTSALGPASTGAETALDLAAVVTSAVPWIGGPVSAVLSGQSFGRKLDRVREALTGVVDDLRAFKSEASEAYVKTEEFEELLENVLRRTAEERNEEKRRLYRAFLTGAIKTVGPSYDERIKLLRILEAVQPDHIRVLRALLQPPPTGDLGYMGSPLQTLNQRLSGPSREHIQQLVSELNDLRLTSLQTLQTMMTAHGAQELRSTVTPLGKQFAEFLLRS